MHFTQDRLKAKVLVILGKKESLSHKARSRRLDLSVLTPYFLSLERSAV